MAVRPDPRSARACGSIRAKVTDPNGPLRARVLAPALAALVMIGSLLAPLPGDWRARVFCAGAALAYAGALLAGRKRRDAELELGAGSVTIKRAGLLGQTVRARDVSGASTARRGGAGDPKISIALAHRRRDGGPIVLEVENDADAKAVRDALGIGHHGFGALGWPTARRPVDAWALGARVVGTIYWLTLAAMNYSRDEALLAVLFMGLAVVPATLFALAAAFFTSAGDGPQLTLSTSGLTTDAHRFVPYARVSRARQAGVRGERVEIDLVDEPAPVIVRLRPTFVGRPRVDAGDAADVAAQIEAAAQRAQGRGEPPPSQEARVSDLARNGEAPRSWLARVDAAAAMLANDTGYRGAGLAEEDLYAALEDHDAPADVRAGAARVLLRVAPETAKPRVTRVLEAVRDPSAREAIRIAAEEDLEEAAELIDALDAKS